MGWEDRVLLKQWVCVLILSSVLIDRSLGLSDDTLMLYSRASLRRRTETNIYGNTWLLNGSWFLSQLFPIWSEHRTQINCAAKVKRVRMHSSWMSSRLNHWPSLVCTRKNNSIEGVGWATWPNRSRRPHTGSRRRGFWLVCSRVDECPDSVSTDTLTAAWA